MRRILCIVLMSMTIMILIIASSSYAYAESKKTYYYSDGYGRHEIQYNLKYGEITKIDCKQRGLTVEMNAEREDKMELYVPATLLDMRGANVDISSDYDHRREQLENSSKLTFKVEGGYSQTRIQTSYGGECKVAPSESIHYKLNPPKIQLENDITPQKIICKKDHNLIFKKSDHVPVCVRHETKKILAEREYYEETIWIRIWLYCDLNGCNMPNWIDAQNYTENQENQITTYLKNKNIEILDARVRSANTILCGEFGECGPEKMEFSFQIFEKDYEKIAENGFDIMH